MNLLWMRMHKTTNLIIDGQSILYRTFFATVNDSLDETIGAAYASLLYKLKYIGEKYNVDNYVMTFDCRNRSWRKLYTSPKNPSKVTHRLYKDGRRENMTEELSQKLKAFDMEIDNFIKFFRKNTSILCLNADYLEADDLIAGYVQYFPEDNHVIYSSDKDFLQLINSINGTVTLVEPSKDEERSLDDWDGNPELFLFEKLFRGEGRGKDNVQSAYPRLFRKKIIEAFTDDYKLNNIMNHEFEVEDMVNDEIILYKYKTKDLFEENKLLMDLKSQPENIRNLINETITDAIENAGDFSFPRFLSFSKKNGFFYIIKDKNNYVPILSKKFVHPKINYLGEF